MKNIYNSNRIFNNKNFSPLNRGKILLPEQKLSQKSITLMITFKILEKKHSIFIAKWVKLIIDTNNIRNSRPYTVKLLIPNHLSL
jgi:hypothetical protein